MEGLGRLYDIAVGNVPTDAVAGAVTGLRVHLKNYSGVSFVVCSAAGSTDITDVDLQQHTLGVGGTTADLDIIDHYYYNSEATLDNDETWVKGTQAAASEITNVGAASEQLLLVIEVDATQLSDGYEWVSLDVPDLGTNGTRFISTIAILRDPVVQRDPRNLATAIA